MKMKKPIWLGFTLLILTATSPADTSTPSGSQLSPAVTAQIASDQKKYPFLYRGFEFSISPASDSGNSFCALYDGVGFIVCSSQPNPSSEVTPAPCHCNYRITPPGFHITPDALFGVKTAGEKAKSIFKFLAITVPQAAAEAVMPAIAAPAAAASDISQQSVSGDVIGHSQISNTMAQIKFYAQKGNNSCDITPPSLPTKFPMADVTTDIHNLIKDFITNCKKYPKSMDLNDPSILGNPQAQYCLQQNVSADNAAQVMKDCNIPEVTAQAGEPGNSELWFPGEPVTSACLSTLKGMGLAGAPLIIWLKQEQDDINGLAPTTNGAAVAQAAADCVSKQSTNSKISAAEQKELDQANADLPNITTADPPPASPPAGGAPSSSGTAGAPPTTPPASSP